MTVFEMLVISSVFLMFATIFIFGIVYLIKGGNINNDKRDDKTLSNGNNNRNDLFDGNNGLDWCDNRHDKLYENGEINNITTIIALTNIKREMERNLSNLEKDAIDKAIKNTMSVEKLYTFIDCETKINE